MKISIIGTGYVGLVSGVGFASKGHDVICVDIVEEKVEMINRGEPPIYEEGLDELLKDVVSDDRLSATTDTEKAVKETDLTFICVGTPSRTDGGVDISGVEKAVEDMIQPLKVKDEYHVFCVKSTVVPGTTEEKVLPILERSDKVVGEDFGLGMNPEFLREGIALEDFLNPDRIVLGGWDEKTLDFLSKAYDEFEAPKLETDIKTAEMIKYTSNALLATKISFANEISRICESIGIDVYGVMDGVGMDHRINRDFLNAGAGFGGSCFPKDVKALVRFAEDSDLEANLLNSVLSINEEQPVHIINRLEKISGGLEDKKVAFLGLAFKGGTDDVRETRALPMVEKLLELDSDVIGYDPEATDNFKELLSGRIQYADDVAEALQNADICIIQSDWDEFKELTAQDFKPMKGKVIVDARRLLDPADLTDDFIYIGVGL
ncbi:MAG: UDP-glucose/GDP-mannose dehydrogenase family protein [Candidatus Saliniplasma sp.]